MNGKLFIGTSGWNYKSWGGGVFYPKQITTRGWLEFYARHFDSVEVNNTFYHLPEKTVFESWRDQTPAEFTFTLKASRFITHMKKLLDPKEHVTLFLKRACGLKDKLSMVLFQLPPFWKFNGERLDAFCNFVAQQKIVPGLRTALEVRNPSWLTEACFEILHKHNIALAFTDWPQVKVTGPITADFVFIRRHGPQGLYSSDYSEAMLREDADRIRSWRSSRHDVYAYFNNDVQGFAVKNALTLKRLTGISRRQRVSQL